MPRPNTPPTRTPSGGRRIIVKMCCERCGREVGDANDAELDAAMTGAPLPKVADECMCLLAEAAAVVARDHVDDTTLPESVGPGRDAYSCACGARVETAPGVTYRDAFTLHVADVIRAALREVAA